MERWRANSTRLGAQCRPPRAGPIWPGVPEEILVCFGVLCARRKDRAEEGLGHRGGAKRRAGAPKCTDGRSSDPAIEAGALPEA